jgi:hypothetical protein
VERDFFYGPIRARRSDFVSVDLTGIDPKVLLDADERFLERFHVGAGGGGRGGKDGGHDEGFHWGILLGPAAGFGSGEDNGESSCDMATRE